MWEYLGFYVARDDTDEKKGVDLPELLTDARRRRNRALPPSGNAIEAREHEKGRQRDPPVERGRFCIAKIIVRKRSTMVSF